MKKTTPRLQFLDCLRFFAALAVIVQHTFERVSPQFGWFCSNYFQFGAFGVCLFFLTSGFIIPVSIEKHKSIKKFAVSRLYRLYPLFLTSLVLKVSLLSNGTINGVTPSLSVVLANITMLAKFLGQPLVEASYWTLNLEMAFYIIVAILFKINLLKHSAKLAVGGLLFVLFIGIICIHTLHLFEGGWLLTFYLATMFVGTVYYRNMNGMASNYTLKAIISMALGVLIINAFFLLSKEQIDTRHFGAESFWPVTNAIVTAYLLFTICFYFRSRPYPKSFVYLGAISYSLYLNQAIILPLVLSNIVNPFLSSTIAIVITFVLSHFTYQYIELPFINISKKLITNRTPSKAKIPLPQGIANSTAELEIGNVDNSAQKRY